MKNNYIGMLSTLLAAQMISDPFMRDNILVEDKKSEVKLQDLIGIAKDRRPALGCKEYFFNKDGKFSTESMRRTEVAYYCHAINDKSAIKKFKKWQIKQIN